MKKYLLLFGAIITLYSCNTKTSKSNFTVSGEIKNIPDQKVYLEELFFNQNPPEIVDSAMIKNGRFVLTAVAPEEGLYRIKTGSNETGFVFINDIAKIDFTADMNNLTFSNHVFNSPANISLKNFITSTDSQILALKEKYAVVNDLKEKGARESDSAYITAQNNYKKVQEQFSIFCFKYADTVKSPVAGIMATTNAPLEMDRFILPLQKLQKRFPAHNGIATSIAYIQQQLHAPQKEAQEPAQQGVSIGAMAPELSMPDTSGKMFSLSSLRGKYVLVDFWASWCGPCRGENPNVVKAYNTFKDKNFTVLGVSLDKDKNNWIKAIHDDHLTWNHISDLQYWSSAAVGLYGFDGIPFNVLVGPNGKIIATGLREEALQKKLAEVLQ